VDLQEFTETNTRGAKMAKSRDAAKEKYWRGVIRRQGASGLGTKRFCAQEGISEHRFYWWRRTLRRRDEHDAQYRSQARGKRRRQDLQGEESQDSDTVGKASPVHGDGIRRSSRLSAHATGEGARHRGCQEDHSPFLPVSLPLSLGVPIEVVHPCGHVIRVPAIFDPVALKRILAVLDISAGPSGEE
jgi:hypothetical protein